MDSLQLYLDDLQWADDTALDMIRTFLSDTMGSCMFFVGTYRDNEIQVGHAVFDLMENLEISNVPTNKVSLTGLEQEDLNKMISDALCLSTHLQVAFRYSVPKDEGESLLRVRIYAIAEVSRPTSV